MKIESVSPKKVAWRVWAGGEIRSNPTLFSAVTDLLRIAFEAGWCMCEEYRDSSAPSGLHAAASELVKAMGEAGSLDASFEVTAALAELVKALKSVEEGK